MFIDDGVTVGAADVIIIGQNATDVDYIAKSQIVKFTGVFSAVPGQYPFPTKTIVRITFADGSAFDIELQNVANQVTWNTGTQAGLNQALLDLSIML